MTKHDSKGGSITRRAEEIQVALSGLRTQLYERRRDRKYHPSQVANSVRQQIQPYQLYPHAVRSISDRVENVGVRVTP